MVVKLMHLYSMNKQNQYLLKQTAVAIFLQKRDTSFLHSPFSTKKVKNGSWIFSFNKLNNKIVHINNLCIKKSKKYYNIIFFYNYRIFQQQMNTCIKKQKIRHNMNNYFTFCNYILRNVSVLQFNNCIVDCSTTFVCFVVFQFYLRMNTSYFLFIKIFFEMWME
jgi:hypothetical protein